MHPQRENSRNGYGLRKSVLVAVIVLMVVLLRLLTNLLMIRMGRRDRTKGSHEQQPKHKTKGSEMLQELPERGLVNVSIATISTGYNEHQVAKAPGAETLELPCPTAAMTRYRIVRDDGQQDSIAGQTYQTYEAAYAVLERYYGDLCCSDEREYYSIEEDPTEVAPLLTGGSSSRP